MLVILKNFYFCKSKHTFIPKTSYKMPKKDNFHDIVTTALVKDNWHIAHDPLFVPTESGTNFFIDLGIQPIIGVEKEGQNVAIEVKSFNENTPFYSFYEMLGQFLVYQTALKEQPIAWELYIGLPVSGYDKLDSTPIFKQVIQQFGLKFITFDPVSKIIVQWKK
jgi:hypothetical protein